MILSHSKSWNLKSIKDFKTISKSSTIGYRSKLKEDSGIENLNTSIELEYLVTEPGMDNQELSDKNKIKKILLLNKFKAINSTYSIQTSLINKKLPNII